VVLPVPGGGTGDPIRKTVSLEDSRINFDGPVLSGWKSGSIYVFRLRAYADAGYTRMIDSLEQRSLCNKPPERYLRQFERRMKPMPNQVTRANAGGRHEFEVRALWAAPIAQFRRSATS